MRHPGASGRTAAERWRVAAAPGASLCWNYQPGDSLLSHCELKPCLAIAATFTAEPLEEVLAFWNDELSLELPIRFAPYHQVFQALLDPSSPLASNGGGVNAVLIRLEDWAAAGDDAPEQFVAALRG